ncbi:hypothetical protein ACWFRF_20755 [Nocardia sp. NPDC055165]
MKIVSKAELQAMPKGTPFAEYHPGAGWPQGFDIFVAPCGYIDDFYYRSISSPENDGTSQLLEREDEMNVTGAAYPVDTDIGREGLHDPAMRYLVWEPEDVARIIHLLQGGDDPADDRP